MDTNHSVLFVCWGNICRSPTAQAVFKKLLSQRGREEKWMVDSAGTGHWNLGELPDPRARRALERQGLKEEHRARVVEEEDFRKFEYIVCMDHSNMENLLQLAPKDSSATLQLLGIFDDEGPEVIEDPYYGSDRDFEVVLERCWKACTGFLDFVERKDGLSGASSCD